MYSMLLFAYAFAKPLDDLTGCYYYPYITEQ
jgi:hypothetical protein